MFSSPPLQDRTQTVNPDWEVLLPESVTAVGTPGGGMLSTAAAQALWREFVSPAEDRLVQLPPEAWPVRILSSPIFTEWRAMWSQDSGRGFDDWLQEALPWEEETPVFFTSSASQSIKATWGAFCRSWRQFTQEAEDAILWSQREGLALRFLPTGIVYLGGRFSPESTEFPNV